MSRAHHPRTAEPHFREASVTAVGLLVLGAIHRRGRTYGYQVRAHLESWGAHEWANAKSGSIYHALKAMAEERLLRARDKSSDAGGPRRTENQADGQGSRGVSRAASSRPCGQGRAPGSAGGGRRADRRLATCGSARTPSPARRVDGCVALVRDRAPAARRESRGVGTSWRGRHPVAPYRAEPRRMDSPAARQARARSLPHG